MSFWSDQWGTQPAKQLVPTDPSKPGLTDLSGNALDPSTSLGFAPANNVSYAPSYTGPAYPGTDTGLKNVSQAVTQPSSAPATSSGAPDFSNPTGQLSAVTSWLQNSGYSNDDPNYWVKRINETGGFTPQNLQYWQARIAAGPAGMQPGGQYYEGTASTAPTGDASGGLDPAMRDAILAAMGRDTAPVSLSDPSLKGQADAYHVTQQRNSDQMRSALAERLAAEGLNAGGQGSGTFDTGVQQIGEQQGQNESGYNANLVGNEVQARRQDLTNQLQLANAFGARKEATQLQMALAQLENTYKYSALNQNQGQFEDNTAFNYAQLKAELDRQALLAGMNGG